MAPVNRAAARVTSEVKKRAGAATAATLSANTVKIAAILLHLDASLAAYDARCGEQGSMSGSTRFDHWLGAAMVATESGVVFPSSALPAALSTRMN
jgi:hypothetical protein